MQISLQLTPIPKQKCLRKISLNNRRELRRLIVSARKLGTTDCVTVFRDGSWTKHTPYRCFQDYEAITTFSVAAVCYFPDKEITLFFKQLNMEINT